MRSELGISPCGQVIGRGGSDMLRVCNDPCKIMGGLDQDEQNGMRHQGLERYHYCTSQTLELERAAWELIHCCC